MRTKHEIRSILVPESNSLNVDSPGNAFNIRRDCSRSERATRVGGDTDDPVLARMPGVPPAGSTGSAEDSVDSISDGLSILQTSPLGPAAISIGRHEPEP